MKKTYRLLALFFSVLFIFSLSCDALISDDIKHSSLKLLEKIENKFTEEKEELKPLGLELNDGRIKKLCIAFNSGLHKMSHHNQKLPLSFENPQSVEVPVLLYHHITEDKGYGDNVLSVSLFEEHLIAIKDAGYNTVSARELIDFVYYGTSLPKNPILLTFDDGYYSNYELAFPILKKHNMKAIIFVIGWAIGKDEYKDTGEEIIKHFDFDEIREMVNTGLIEVQSHTFDMHQSPTLENSKKIRESVLKFEDETDDEYILALEKDYRSFDTLLFNNTGNRNYAIAYPHGDYSTVSEEVFKRLGTYITFSTEFSKKNTLVQGELDCLRALNRFTVSEHISKDGLLEMIQSVYN